MKTEKQLKSNRRTWIEYGILALIAFILYATGLHTEVIGFAQRGILATGLMNPDVEEVMENRENLTLAPSEQKIVPADFNLNLMDPDGNSVSLASMKGKVIFINFWATWCPPCIAEMPSIRDLKDDVGDRVTFVMISRDDDFKTAIEFNKRKEYNLPIYALPGGLPSMYQSTALPTTYIIDAAGRLVLTHKGMADYDTQEFKDFLLSLE
jgi:thiol-disulfide isomerase/thioredoxin